MDCYHAHSKEYTSYKLQNQSKGEIMPPVYPPKPVAKIGNSVEVTGTVREVHDTRQLNVTNISMYCHFTATTFECYLYKVRSEVCSSPNEELLHARTVRFLHQTTYCNKGSFIIPHTSSTPQKAKIPVTPSIMGSGPPSSVSSSPIKSPQVDLKYKVNIC